MKPPAPIWTADYQHDRRNARHRCRCCNRSLTAGESVIMARVGGGKTWAIHAACGDVQHGTAAWTWRDAMTCWGDGLSHRLRLEIAARATAGRESGLNPELEHSQ